MLVVALRRTAIERDFSLGKVFLFHRRSLYDMVIYTIDGIYADNKNVSELELIAEWICDIA